MTPSCPFGDHSPVPTSSLLAHLATFLSPEAESLEWCTAGREVTCSLCGPSAYDTTRSAEQMLNNCLLSPSGDRLSFIIFHLSSVWICGENGTARTLNASPHSHYWCAWNILARRPLCPLCRVPGHCVGSWNWLDSSPRAPTFGLELLSSAPQCLLLWFSKEENAKDSGVFGG